MSCSRDSSPPCEEQVARVAAEGLLADGAAGGLGARERRAAPVVGQSHGDPSSDEIDATLRRALRVVGASEGARVGAVVPEVDPLVELLLVEVGEARALRVGLPVEAEPGWEEQHRRHRLGLEHHLVGAGVELDGVGAADGLGRGELADPATVEVGEALRGRLAVAVGGRPVDRRRPVDGVHLRHRRPARVAEPGGGAQHVGVGVGGAVARPTRGRGRLRRSRPRSRRARRVTPPRCRRRSDRRRPHRRDRRGPGTPGRLGRGGRRRSCPPRGAPARRGRPAWWRPGRCDRRRRRCGAARDRRRWPCSGGCGCWRTA